MGQEILHSRNGNLPHLIKMNGIFSNREGACFKYFLNFYNTFTFIESLQR